MSECIVGGLMEVGGSFGIARSGSSQQSQFQLSNASQQAMAKQQLQNSLAVQQWNRNSIQQYGYILQNVAYQPRLATQWETDYAEGMAEANRICKVVIDWFELCDLVANNEVESIAPGWKD